MLLRFAPLVPRIPSTKLWPSRTEPPWQASKASKQAASTGEMLAANSCGQCRAFQLDNSSLAQSSPFWTSLPSTLPETLSWPPLSPDSCPHTVLHNQTHRHTPSLMFPHA